MMNITKAPPAKIPMKLYLLLTTLFPNGKRNLALTAKTCGKRVGRRKNRDKATSYVEALRKEY
jgi:hypothetical protein